MKATPVTRIVKFKALGTVAKADGTESYRLTAYLPYGKGYSRFPTELYVQGEKQIAILQVLQALAPESLVEVELSPGKIKPDKPDDGDFGSYFWNVTGIGGNGATPVSQAPAAPHITVDPTRASIERQVALKAAVELAGYNIATAKVSMKSTDVLVVAEKFYEWLRSDSKTWSTTI